MKEIVKRIVAFVMVLMVAITGIPKTAGAKTVKKHFYVNPVSDMDTNNYNWECGLQDLNGELYDTLITGGDSYTGQQASYYIIRYKKDGKVTKEKLPIKKKNSVLTMTAFRWDQGPSGYNLAIGCDGNYHISCDINLPSEYDDPIWTDFVYYIVSKKGKVLEKFNLNKDENLKGKIKEACVAAGMDLGERPEVSVRGGCGYQKDHLLLGCFVDRYPNATEKANGKNWIDYYIIADYDYKADKINWIRNLGTDNHFGTKEYYLNSASTIVKSGDSYALIDESKGGVRIVDIKTGEEKLNLPLDYKKGWYDTSYYDGMVYGVKDAGIYKYNIKTEKWKKVCSLSSSDLKKLHASEKLPISLRVVNQKSFLLYSHKWLFEYHKKKLKVLRIDL